MYLEVIPGQIGLPISWPRKRVKQGRALIFLFCLKFCVTRIMAASSFDLCGIYTLKSCRASRGLTVSKCVREDRAVSQNRRASMRYYSESRIEQVNDSHTMSDLDRPIRASLGTCFVTRNKSVRVQEKPVSHVSRYSYPQPSSLLLGSACRARVQKTHHDKMACHHCL